MAVATNYQRLIQRSVMTITGQRIAPYPEELAEDLKNIATRLHDYDGWCDWPEIWAALYTEADRIISRHNTSEPGIWQDLRRVLDEWYSNKRLA